VLNIAGPRESEDPEIYEKTHALLLCAFSLGGTARLFNPEEMKDALANFRHWDSVRWQGIFWYLGLSAPAVAVISHEGVANEAAALAAFVLFILGVLAVRLVWNTQRYHVQAEDRFPPGYAGVSFSFRGRKWLSTATAWGMLASAALSLGWLAETVHYVWKTWQ
jgi:hypothetical protein